MVKILKRALYWRIFHVIWLLPKTIDSYKGEPETKGDRNFYLEPFFALKYLSFYWRYILKWSTNRFKRIFYFKIFNIFIYLDNHTGLRQQIQMFFLNPAFSWNMAIFHIRNSAVIMIKNWIRNTISIYSGIHRSEICIYNRYH